MTRPPMELLKRVKWMDASIRLDALPKSERGYLLRSPSYLDACVVLNRNDSNADQRRTIELAIDHLSYRGDGLPLFVKLNWR